MRIRICWLSSFAFRHRGRRIQLRGKPQSALDAHTAARQQPCLHLFACLRVSIGSQCRRNGDDFVLRDHFRSERNVRGHSGYTLRGRPPPLELTSPLCGIIPTLLPDRRNYSIGGSSANSRVSSRLGSIKGSGAPSA